MTDAPAVIERIHTELDRQCLSLSRDDYREVLQVLQASIQCQLESLDDEESEEEPA